MAPGPGPNTYVARRTTTRSSTRRSSPASPAVYEFRVSGKPHYLVEFPRARRLERPAGRAGSRRRPPRRPRVSGASPLRPLLFLQHHRRGHERPGAQELDRHQHPTRVDDQPRRATSGGSAWRPTSIFTRGTSNGFDPSSWGRSTTRTRSTQRGCGLPRVSPTTTPICCWRARV